MILYRILSAIVTLFCSFLAMITLFGIFMAFSSPQLLFQCFLMAGVVLYGWFANRFFAQVVIHKKAMTKRQKDWLQVNGIVALVFSVMGIVSCIVLITDPEQVKELIKAFPGETGVDANSLIKVAEVLLGIFSVLFVHIIWTYLLIRKHKTFFTS